MRAHLCLTEEWRPACRAESPVHLIATVRDTCIVVGLAGHDECRCTEAGVDRSASGTEILALPAPAYARDDRPRRAFPADFPAETSTCDRHSVLHPTTANPVIVDATSEGDITAISPRLHAHSTLERPLTATCLCGRSWPIAPVDQHWLNDRNHRQPAIGRRKAQWQIGLSVGSSNVVGQCPSGRIPIRTL
jgi:hypothetical protein